MSSDCRLCLVLCSKSEWDRQQHHIITGTTEQVVRVDEIRVDEIHSKRYHASHPSDQVTAVVALHSTLRVTGYITCTENARHVWTMSSGSTEPVHLDLNVLIERGRAS